MGGRHSIRRPRRLRFAWFWWGLLDGIAIARGWRASHYSGTYYRPLIYGVSIAWWDASVFNHELRARQVSMLKQIAEMREAMARCR